MVHRLWIRTGAAVAGLSLLVASTPAFAVEPPPSEPPPQFDYPTYALPDVEIIEGIEITQHSDPGISQWVEDMMFDFDDGCWEEGGEQSGPMSVSATTVWQESDTRWMVKYLDAERSEDFPAIAAFEPPDDEEQIEFVSRGLEALEHELAIEAEYETSTAATPWGDLSTAALSNYPVTNGSLDTDYWDENAAADFWDCLYADYYAAAAAHAAATGALVAAPTGLPTTEQITSCYEQVVGSWGPVCLPVDETLCTDLDWHASWCGRRAYVVDGADPGWVCAQALTEAVDQYVADTGAVAEPLLKPEETFTGGQRTEHPGLPRVMGLKIEASHDSSYHESDRFSDTATVSPETELLETLERVTWEANGAQIASCEEYAYERYYDMSELDWAAKDHQRNARWIFDAAFFGRDGIGPYITAAPSEPDFRERDGNPTWLNNQYWPDDGYVPWTRTDRFAPEEFRRRHRLFANFRPGHPWDTRLSTFKNVYYYLHRLRKGPVEQHEGDCDDWREHLRQHYTVNTGWHRVMDGVAKQQGFLDEEMERMRGKQDALWTIYQEYLASDDPSERALLTEQIDDALREGYAAGCIPLDPSTPTACDWSPSLFSEGVLNDLNQWRLHDYGKCVDELGDGSFSNADLQAKFVDISSAAAGIGGAWLTMLQTARAHALSRNYTASAGALRGYFYDMLGFGNSWGYRELIQQAVGRLGDRAFVESSEFEKTLGNDFFGISMQHLSTAQAGGIDGRRPCQPVPAADGLDTVTARLGPINKEFIKAVADLIETERPLDPSEYPDPPEGSDEFDPNEHEAERPWDGGFNWDVWVGGELSHEPGYGTSLSSTVGMSIAYSYGYSNTIPLAMVGPVTFKVRYGANGSVGVDGAFSASKVWLSPEDAGYMQISDEARDLMGDTSACEDPTTSRITFSLVPGARISGSAAVGASVGYVLEAGIKGTLTLIDASVPMSYSIIRTNNNPARTPRSTNDESVDLVLEMLSGSLSLYVALDVVITTIPIFEVVLAKWSGRRWHKPLVDKEVENKDLCITHELSVIGQTLTSGGSGGDHCPCTLRPSNCHD